MLHEDYPQCNILEMFARCRYYVLFYSYLWTISVFTFLDALVLRMYLRGQLGDAAYVTVLVYGLFLSVLLKMTYIFLLLFHGVCSNGREMMGLSKVPTGLFNLMWVVPTKLVDVSCWIE